MNKPTSPSTDLIPINSNMGGKRTVNARDLHEFLESKQDFSTWIKKRVKQYGFLENLDFLIIPSAPQKNGALKSTTYGQSRIDYHLTMDMAKELSMVERTEKGRQARRYFIQCEKIARGQAQPLAAPTPAQIPAKIETLTPVQWTEVKKLVLGKAQRNVGDKKPTKNDYIKIYRSIKEEFQVAKSSDVPQTRFNELRAFLGDAWSVVPLEDEDISNAYLYVLKQDAEHAVGYIMERMNSIMTEMLNISNAVGVVFPEELKAQGNRGFVPERVMTEGGVL